MNYICPRCKRDNLLIVELDQNYFKYKATCLYCVYYDYLNTLDKLETKSE